jgi:hypothetical protein
MNKPVSSKKPPKEREKLGKYLISAGLIDEKTLAKALEIQEVQKKKLV